MFSNCSLRNMEAFYAIVFVDAIHVIVNLKCNVDNETFYCVMA